MIRHRPGRFPARTDGLFYLNFRATDRDRWILAMLREHQVLTAQHFAALAFGSLRTANRRLAELAELGLVDRTRSNPTGPGPSSYLYTLGPQGALLLGAERGLSVKELRYDRARAQRQALRPDIAHTLGCNTLMTRLAAHDAGTGPRLNVWLGPLSCLRRWGNQIRPDAYGHQAEPSTDPGLGCGFFLEYDTGTESVRQLAAKVHGYNRFAQNHTGHRPVLIHTSAPAREARLHEVLTETFGICPVPIATTTDPQVAGPVWLPHDATARTTISILPETFVARGYRILTPLEHDPEYPAPVWNRQGQQGGRYGP